MLCIGYILNMQNQYAEIVNCKRYKKDYIKRIDESKLSLDR